MRERFLKYIIDCFGTVPASVYVGILVVLCLGSILLFAFLGRKMGMMWSTRLLLLVYLFWIFGMTVLFRSAMSTRAIHPIPFSSYSSLPGSGLRLVEIISNVAVFVPVGFLLGCAFGRMRWWKVLLIGGGFSVLIETLQFFLKRGFAEFDDVFHNVVGCMIGFGIYVGVRWKVEMGKRKKMR